MDDQATGQLRHAAEMLPETLAQPDIAAVHDRARLLRRRRAGLRGLILAIVVVGVGGAAQWMAPWAPGTSQQAHPAAPSSRADEEPPPRDDEVCADPSWAGEMGAKRGRCATRGYAPEGDSEGGITIKGFPTAGLVESCKSSDPPTTRLHCRAIIAVSEGKLSPGSYYDDELKQLLEP